MKRSIGVAVLGFAAVSGCSVEERSEDRTEWDASVEASSPDAGRDANQPPSEARADSAVDSQDENLLESGWSVTSDAPEGATQDDEPGRDGASDAGGDRPSGDSSDAAGLPGDAGKGDELIPDADASADAPSPEAPVVVSSSLAEGATVSDRLAAITLTFSHPMDAASLTSAISVHVGTVEIPGTVTASGAVATFTPSRPYVLAAQHRVSVTSTARDSGSVALASAWESTFAVREGIWTSAASAVDPTSTSLGSLGAGMDANGAAVLTWISSTSGSSIVHATRCMRASGLQTTTDFGLADVATLSVASNGEAVLAWTTGGLVREALFDGHQWSATQSLGSANDTQVSAGITPAGEALTVWPGTSIFDSGLNTDYFARSYTPTYGLAGSSSRLQATGQVNTANGAPIILSAQAGEGLVLWEAYDESGSSQLRAWYSHVQYGAQSGFSTASSVPFATDISGLGAAVASSGRGFAVWTQTGQNGSNVMALPVRVDGTFGTSTEQLSSDGSSDTPTVAVSDDGTAVAAWFANGTGGQDLWVSHYDGTQWSAASTIHTDPSPGGKGQYPDLRAYLDAAGNGYIEWNTTANANSESRHAAMLRYKAGDWETSPERVASTDPGPADSAAFAVGTQGDAIAVWETCDSTWTTCGLSYRVFQ